MKNKEEENQQKTDYAAYAYKSTDQLTISGQLFNSISSLLSTLGEDETKLFFSEQETLDDFYAQVPLAYKTPKGMAISKLMDELWYVHQENVDNGKATLIEEIKKEASKPSVSLVSN